MNTNLMNNNRWCACWNISAGSVISEEDLGI